MNRESYDTSWWEKTEEYGPWRRGIKSPIYRNLKTGDLKEGPELPVGALFVLDAAGQHPGIYPAGADGLAIACRLPEGHTWHIDSRASNCTMKTDTAHRCWIRHGSVGEMLTVDKQGNTCQAGGGSINVDGIWHGFLRAGRLVSC